MAETLIDRSWTSVIFEGKNKNYGAFELRRLYDNNINRALIIAVFIFTVFVSLPLILSMINFGAKEEVKEEMVEVVLQPPPPLDPKLPPPPPPPNIEAPKLAASVKFLPPKVEEDEKVKEEDPPTVDEMKDKVISTENKVGEKASVDVIEESNGTGSVIEEPKQEEVFLVVEESASFPGGQGAMMKFLAENIRYPKQASSQNVEGRVIVSFIINHDGDVTNVEVMKGIGYGCDEEAMRVIKMMPKWKPPRQNGRNVLQKFNVPVKFTLSTN